MSLNQSNSQQFPLPQFSAGPAVIDVATTLVQAGFSLIPIAIDGTKSPAWWLLPEVIRPDGTRQRRWKGFQSRMPTPAELHAWFASGGPPPGIGIVAGAVSGNLEVIDLDSVDIAQAWLDLVAQQNSNLLDRLPMVLTPRPGLHVYLRSDVCAGSQKLAQRHEIDQATGKLETKTLIETKGEGGFLVAPGSSAYCHPSGRPYQYLFADRDLTQIQVISAAERDLLLNAARSFDEVPRQPRTPPPLQRARSRNPALPGNDFDARADWTEILTRAGWTFVSADLDGKQYWRRPGKSEGVSGTLNFAGNDMLHVFSSNAPHLEAEKFYSKFAFVTAVEHGADFRAAAQALRAAGYGRQQMRQGRRRRARHPTGARRNRPRRHRRK